MNKLFVFGVVSIFVGVSAYAGEVSRANEGITFDCEGEVVDAEMPNGDQIPYSQQFVSGDLDFTNRVANFTFKTVMLNPENGAPTIKRMSSNITAIHYSGDVSIDLDGVPGNLRFDDATGENVRMMMTGKYLNDEMGRFSCKMAIRSPASDNHRANLFLHRFKFQCIGATLYAKLPNGNRVPHSRIRYEGEVNFDKNSFKAVRSFEMLSSHFPSPNTPPWKIDGPIRNIDFEFNDGSATKIYLWANAFYGFSIDDITNGSSSGALLMFAAEQSKRDTYECRFQSREKLNR